jgi:GNAT superfamily N-acetyltransferase
VGTTGDLMTKLRPCDPSEVQELIKLAIGSPTPEKVQQVLASYKKPDHHFLGYYNEEKLAGFIGLHINCSHGIIKHIAVLESYQTQGIGKVLITEAINLFHLNTCEAETDEVGKGFYEKCDFECVTFQGKYNLRYSCKWEKN